MKTKSESRIDYNSVVANLPRDVRLLFALALKLREEHLLAVAVDAELEHELAKGIAGVVTASGDNFIAAWRELGNALIDSGEVALPE